MLGNRFFSLGCSFTSYGYPTWADWLGSEFLIFENAGFIGSGNRAIFNRLSELIYKKSITKDDTIVVAWSTPIREDRYYSQHGGWVGIGNIYNQNFYPIDWVKKYFDPFMGLMESINYVHAALHMLDNIGCKYAMTWIMPPMNIDLHVENEDAKKFVDLCDPDNKLKPYLEFISKHEKMCKIDIQSYCVNLEKTIVLPNVKRDGNKIDSHPKPVSSYFYVKEILCPHMGFTDFDKSNKLLPLAYEWMNYVSEWPRKNKAPSWTRHGRNEFNGF